MPQALHRKDTPSRYTNWFLISFNKYATCYNNQHVSSQRRRLWFNKRHCRRHINPLNPELNPICYLLLGFEPKISAGERPQAARLLRSWVRIPPGAWIFVCRECRVLSGRGLCDELITRPEESYRLCCVVVCDLETSRIGAPYIYIYI